MSPKKATASRGKTALAKKPSPKKYSPKKSSPKKSPNSRKKKISTSKSYLSTSTLDDTDQQQSQPSTPLETNERPSPRSNERYDLRNITPQGGESHIYQTPFRTPSGVLRRRSVQNPRQTPCATPFRTPRLRHLDKETQPDQETAFKLHKDEAVTWKKHLKSLTSKVQKLCYLSSMTNFKYQNKQFRKKYENVLKSKVLDVYPSPMLTVSLSTSSCLTLQPEAVDAVRIEIDSLKLGETSNDDIMVNVYNAWLFRTTETQTQSKDGLEWFPLMFYTGREDIHHTVINWLQGCFGCYVSKFGVKRDVLMWMAGVWSKRKCPSKSHRDKKFLIVDFVYRIHPPHGMEHFPSSNQKGKPRVWMSVSLEDIHHVWDNIVGDDSDLIKWEELEQYFTIMDNLAEKVTLLPRYLLHLHQLMTPCLDLRADGRVRIPCIKSVRNLVNYLIDFFMQSINVTSEEESLADSLMAHEMGSTAGDRTY